MPIRWYTVSVHICGVGSLMAGEVSISIAAEGTIPVYFLPSVSYASRTRLNSSYVENAEHSSLYSQAGFLGGWIVLHLLSRGEDPRRIRIVDIRRPVRQDLLEGPATQVDFCKADVSDAASVDAAFRKPWPDTHDGPEPEITVFHTAAIIRFYERSPQLQPYSDGVNVKGTENVLSAARKIGASTLVYTSSGSVAVRSNRFFRWPWEGTVEHAVQVITEDDKHVPKRHEDFFSNYAVSKWKAEGLVRAADRTPSGHRTLRTGSIRPGNGIYGTGGDLMLDQYMVRKSNPSWIWDMIQSFVHVENVSLAHLCYEARLIALESGAPAQPDIGGQSFIVADAGPPPTYGDVYRGMEMLTGGAVTFLHLSSTALLLFATLIERYYLARHALLRVAPKLAKLAPALAGDVVFLQPSMWSLTQVHLFFDDSRARAAPEAGGLGYNGRVTTMEGMCKVVAEHGRNGGTTEARRIVPGNHTVDHVFDLTRAEKGVEEVIEKLGLANSVDKPQLAAKIEY